MRRRRLKSLNEDISQREFIQVRDIAAKALLDSAELRLRDLTPILEAIEKALRAIEFKQEGHSLERFLMAIDLGFKKAVDKIRTDTFTD